MGQHDRYFLPLTVPVEGGRRRVHRVRCSECPAVDDISANTFSGSRANEDLMKVWRRRGWELGNRPHRDLCPSCASERRKKQREAKRPHLIETATEAPAMSITPTAEIIEMNPPPAAEPPPEMSRDDRRLIFVKLHEVYLDERTGYAGDWTDKRVAEDLGVPQAWVAKVRDENFGPAKSNAEIDALRTDLATMLQQAEQHRREADALTADIRDVTAQIKAAVAKVDELSTAQEALEKRRSRSIDTAGRLIAEAERLGRRMDRIEKALLP